MWKKFGIFLGNGSSKQLYYYKKENARTGLSVKSTFCPLSSPHKRPTLPRALWCLGPGRLLRYPSFSWAPLQLRYTGLKFIMCMSKRWVFMLSKGKEACVYGGIVCEWEGIQIYKGPVCLSVSRGPIIKENSDKPRAIISHLFRASNCFPTPSSFNDGLRAFQRHFTFTVVNGVG